jgi:hypothetical protein
MMQSLDIAIRWLVFIGILLVSPAIIIAVLTHESSHAATSCWEQCAIDRKVCEIALKKHNYRHYKLVCGVAQCNCEKLCNVEDEAMASVVK